jgi:predicted RNase H-like HicB family nuclease
MTLTAILTPDADGGYVATNPETGTTSQGENVAEALANLKEATTLYLEEFPLESNGQPLFTTFEVEHAEAPAH